MYERQPTATNGRRRGPQRYAAAAVLTLLWLTTSSAVHSERDALFGFAGGYIGVRVVEATVRPTLTPADIHLDVRARDEGFVLRWQSLTESADIKHHYEVVFDKTTLPGIFLAGMRCNVFGHSIPLDPARGEPYVWAHLAEDRLTLYAMSIANDGSHDLSRYRYRRDGNGLTLEFRRMKDDQPLESARAVLRRIAAVERPVAPASEQNAERHTGASCG